MAKDVPWIAIVAVAIPGSVLVWAILKFLLRPFLVWQHRELAKQAFQEEFEQVKDREAVIGELQMSIGEILVRVTQLEEDMEHTHEVLQTIPAIGESARRSVEACQRVEVALGDMREHMLDVAQQLGQVQGATKSKFGGTP